MTTYTRKRAKKGKKVIRCCVEKDTMLIPDRQWTKELLEIINSGKIPNCKRKVFFSTEVGLKEYAAEVYGVVV